MLDLKRPRSILVYWMFAHLGIFLTLAAHQDDDPVFFNRYNPGYSTLLGFIVVFALIGAVIIWRANAIRLPRRVEMLRVNNIVRVVVLAAGMSGLLAIWLISFPFSVLPIQKELTRAYLTAAVLLTTYMLLFWRGRDQCVPWSVYIAALGVLAVVGVVITVHYLDRFPQLNTIDELHNWVVQWTYANTGLLGDTLYKQMIPLPQPIYDSPHYIAGLLLRLFGDGFWQARFVRLLMACIALPFIYLTGQRMYGRRAALFAVVVAIFFLAPTAYVRPDVFVGVMLSIALYVYMRAQTTRRPWMHYLTGLCVAIAGEGHPLAYRFGLAFGLIYGLRWIYEMWQARRLKLDGRVFALAMGGLTGMLIYLSIHIIPGWEQGLHFARNYTPVSRTLAEQFNLGAHTVVEQLTIWLETSPFEFVLFMVGIGVAVIELKDGDRVLLILLLVSEVLMIATYGYYREFYQVHFLPIVALLGGRLLANLTELRAERFSPGRLSGFALATMLVIVSVFSLYQTADSAKDDPTRDEFTAIGQQLKADLPPNAIVMGNENYFLKIRSPNYYGIQTVTTDQWFLAKYQGYPLLEVTHPDIIIMSGSEMDIPKYTPLGDLNQYIADNNFQLARCYTHTDLIQAYVYVKALPSGWTIDPECHPR